MRYFNTWQMLGVTPAASSGASPAIVDKRQIKATWLSSPAQNRLQRQKGQQVEYCTHGVGSAAVPPITPVPALYRISTRPVNLIRCCSTELTERMSGDAPRKERQNWRAGQRIFLLPAPAIRTRQPELEERQHCSGLKVAPLKQHRVNTFH